MLRSMTAFARGQAAGERENFLVEIHSVNSKRLEISVNIPGELTEFDPPLRKLIARALSRGRVTVFVSCQLAIDKGGALHPNTDLARQLKNAYDELRRSLDYDPGVDFSMIASHPEIMVPANRSSDPEKRWSAIKTAAECALHDLLAMKDTEGQNLRSAFDRSLNELTGIVASIEQFAPAALEKHTQTLKDKIAEATPSLPDNQERILREIVVLADRLDLSEELARLKSHIAQFRELIRGDEPCGRTLDFLIQEMNREVNTIASKADDLNVSKLVVRGKTELEKLREQTQNIE